VVSAVNWNDNSFLKQKDKTPHHCVLMDSYKHHENLPLRTGEIYSQTQADMLCFPIKSPPSKQAESFS